MKILHPGIDISNSSETVEDNNEAEENNEESDPVIQTIEKDCNDRYKNFSFRRRSRCSLSGNEGVTQLDAVAATKAFMVNKDGAARDSGETTVVNMLSFVRTHYAEVIFSIIILYFNEKFI